MDENKVEKGDVAMRCSVCRHAPHESIGFCPNMASDNDCDCPGGPAEPIAQVETDQPEACRRYPSAHAPGVLPDHCDGCRWLHVASTVERAVNSAYGTDPRHALLGRWVADDVLLGKPLPFRLAEHFGRAAIASSSVPSSPEGGTRD